MKDSLEFVTRSNKKIEKLSAIDNSTDVFNKPNVSALDRAEPWMWATDEGNTVTDDNGEDYIVRMDDRSYVRWENTERKYFVAHSPTLDRV